MKKLLFAGSGVAIVTPFTEDAIDFDKLGELIEFQIDQKTDAIIVCGTTGESATMNEDEKKEAIKYVIEKAAKRVPVIAGTGSNNTKHSIELSKYAQEAGTDGLLIVTPYYNKTTQRGLVEHYAAISKSVTLPIIMYNVPGRTGLNMTAETAKELSMIENIVATKEASGNITQIAEIAALCGENLTIYSGNDDQVVPVLSLGGKGVISVAANIIPKDVHEMVAKYLEGDIKGSLKMQLKMMELVKWLFIEVNPMPIKEAMNIMGLNVGRCRLPLTDMSRKNSEGLRSVMRSYGI